MKRVESRLWKRTGWIGPFQKGIKSAVELSRMPEGAASGASGDRTQKEQRDPVGERGGFILWGNNR